MTDATPVTGPGARLVALLDHLGIERTHVCSRSPLDVLELLAVAPERIASVVLQGAEAGPEEFAALGGRILWLMGDRGSSQRTMAPRLAGRPETNVHWIHGYPEYTWSNTVADRTEEVSSAVLEFLERIEAEGAPHSVTLSGAGEASAITYRAAGSGTPVLLLPLGLSARQWDPLLPALQAGHCAIVAGGRHLQPVENLEARASGDYSRMAMSLLDMAAPQPGESLIEVGCGSGALLRRIARRAPHTQVTGLDVNGFLLREARALAAAEGLSDSLTFKEGSAVAIPFPDGTFDIAFSSTVMEEVDADRMLSEMVRITRPGGRVAVAVRSVDRGSWTNLPLPPELKANVEAPAGAVSEGGCADDSLSRRFYDAGLSAIRGGPSWAWVTPEDGWWKNVVLPIRRALSDGEYAAFEEALAAAQRHGLPVWIARPFHCAIGTK